MARLGVFAVAIFLALGSSAGALTLSGKQLQNYCGSNAVMCLSYFMGFADSLTAVHATGVDGNPLCAPDGDAASKLKADFLNYAAGHADQLDKDARVLVIEASKAAGSLSCSKPI